MKPMLCEVGPAAKFGLSFHEMKVLLMMAANRSAKEIRARIALRPAEPVSPDLVLKIVNRVRTKLSCAMNETLVDCARRQGVIK